EMRLSVKLVEQAVGGACRILTDQAFEEGHESRTIHLLPKSSGRRLFQVMRLVDDQVVVLRKQAAADLDVGQEEGVVDDDQIGRLRLGACAVDVAVLLGAVDADAVEWIARDLCPQHLLTSVE